MISGSIFLKNMNFYQAENLYFLCYFHSKIIIFFCLTKLMFLRKLYVFFQIPVLGVSFFYNCEFLFFFIDFYHVLTPKNSLAFKVCLLKKSCFLIYMYVQKNCSKMFFQLEVKKYIFIKNDFSEKPGKNMLLLEKISFHIHCMI